MEKNGKLKLKLKKYPQLKWHWSLNTLRISVVLLDVSAEEPWRPPGWNRAADSFGTWIWLATERFVSGARLDWPSILASGTNDPTNCSDSHCSVGLAGCHTAYRWTHCWLLCLLGDSCDPWVVTVLGCSRFDSCATVDLRESVKIVTAFDTTYGTLNLSFRIIIMMIIIIGVWVIVFVSDRVVKITLGG